jgi:D-alanyl-D-alanine carboxypeptidase
MQNKFIAASIIIIALVASIVTMLLTPLTHAQQSVIVPVASGDTIIPQPVASCDNPLVLIDQTHGVSASFVPPDLVPLTDYGISVQDPSIEARLDMVGELKSMLATMTSQGINVSVLSGYRSYTTQAGIDDGFQAPPGHSQHQLGVAIDFTTNNPLYVQTGNFDATPAGKWLAQNAYKYGFYIAYPQGSEAITGYNYEPWHYRYMGVATALAMKQSGLLMQIYLEKYGVLPDC